MLTMIISSTLNDLNVLPAHVNTLDPLILTSSPSPSSFITFGCNTKSPLKSILAPKIPSHSWWTDKTSPKSNFWMVLVEITAPSSVVVFPFILSCSLSINVPETWSSKWVFELPPAFTANPVAPLLNPSTKLPTGNWLLPSVRLITICVYNWISYK